MLHGISYEKLLSVWKMHFLNIASSTDQDKSIQFNPQTDSEFCQTGRLFRLSLLSKPPTSK